MKPRLIPALLLLAVGPAFAGEPYCNIEESCTEHKENCTPLEGRLTVAMQANGKALVTLMDREALESTVLVMNDKTLLIFNHEGEEHQLRIGGDGKFNYLISTPDPDAYKGKQQIMYRGQCVEG